MREMICDESGHNEEKISIGFSNRIYWLDDNYCGGPNIAGKYFVRFEDGTFDELYGYGGNKDGLDLVISHIRNDVRILHENGKEFSADEILILGRSYHIWFEKLEDEYGDLDMIIIHDQNPPKYFMIPEIGNKGLSKLFDEVEGQDYYKFKDSFNSETDDFNYEKKNEEVL